MNAFPISKDLALPIEAATDTIGVLAVKGAGKTYTFLVLAEGMIDHGIPCVIFDPIGVCWGLRAGADGESRGLPVVVLGGSHGDLPLDPHAGRTLAEFAASERRSIVLDFSAFETKADQIRFAQAFLSRLYEVNREPLHVFLDEADDVAPQKPFGEETRLLRAAEILVRRGRARGIGVTMVTQRPAVLNKNILTQCGTLIVGRVTSPNDRKAIEAWVDANGTAAQKKALWDSLASLPTSDKWIWSPQAGIFQRVRIGARKTFDSSATPKLGAVRVVPKQMAPVDLDELRARMGEAIERAKADDPKVLRERIKELEKQVLKDAPEPICVVKEVRVPFIPADVVRELGIALDAADSVRSQIRRALESLDLAVEQAAKTSERDILTLGPTQHVANRNGTDAAVLSRRAEAPKSAAPPRGKGKRHPDIGNSGLSRMLIALAQRNGLTNRQLGLRAAISAQSGTFSNYLSKARGMGWIRDEGDRRFITPEGLHALGPFQPLPEGRELLAHYLGELGQSGASRILSALADAYPNTLTNSEVGEKADISPESGTFSNYLSKLRGLELITGGRGTPLRASEELFS